MANYSVRFVHKISPNEKDVGPDITLGDQHLVDKNTLAHALRERRILVKGQSLHRFRVEGEKVVCFPRPSIWHSIILTKKTPAKAEDPKTAEVDLGDFMLDCNLDSGQVDVYRTSLLVTHSGEAYWLENKLVGRVGRTLTDDDWSRFERELKERKV